MTGSEIAVFVEPITHHFVGDRLFVPHGYAGSYYEPFAAVREAFAPHGIEVHTADLLREGQHRARRNLYFSIGNIKHYRRLAAQRDVLLSALFHFEAPIIHPSVYRDTPAAARAFGRVYSFSTSEALAPFGCAGVPLEPFRIPEPRNEVYEELWSNRDRGFLTIISQNKLPVLSYNELYTERLRALEFFSRTGSIDLYGVGWDRLPFRVGERRTPQHLVRLYRHVRERVPLGKLHPYEDVIKKVYRGPVESKYETLSRYRFALTYENLVLDGWINEKIFDAFLAGTVPVYLGAPDVTDWIPPECFIDRRRFSSDAELGDYLRSLSPQEVEAFRVAAREFLASPEFRPFSKEAFAELFLRSAESDLGIELTAAA